MRTARTLLVTAVMLTYSESICAFARTPTLAPELSSIFPHGMQRGRSAEVRFRGRYLARISRIEFFGTGVSAEIVRATDSEVLTRVNADPAAPLGRRDVRVYTDRGSVLGVFDVGTLPEITEQEPNDEFEQAQLVSPPILVNGAVGPGADYDHFKFHARAGQTLIFDVNATRNGSYLDSSLTIFTDKGRRLAFNDDYYIHKDPFLSYTFQNAGDYILRVRARDDNGSVNYDYRLTLGELPHLANSFPAGARRGTKCELLIRGTNVGRVREIVVGEKLRGQVLARKDGEIRASIALPEDFPLGIHTLRVVDENGFASGPISFEVSDLKEITISPGAARNKSDPFPIDAPVVLNGVLDQRRVADYFVFRAEAGQRIEFSVESMHLGYLLDPALALYDESGAQIAFEDDPAPNNYKEPPNLDPVIVHEFEKPGRYTIMVRDAAYAAHPEAPYRLAVRAAKPDFELRILTSEQTVLRGEPAKVELRVKRMGGWNSAVEIWAEDLPPGVTASKLDAEPKDTHYAGCNNEDFWVDGTNLDLPLNITSDAQTTTRPLQLHARGAFEGNTVEHTAVAWYLFKGGGGGVGRKLIGETQGKAMLLSVVDPPHFKLQSPAQVTLDRVKSENLKITVERLAGEKRAIRIKALYVPPGIICDSALIPAGRDEVELIVRRDGDIAENSILMLEAAEQTADADPQTQYADIRVERPSARSEKER